MGVDPSCSSTCAFLRGLSGRETSGSSETILLPTFRAPSVSSGLTLLCPRGSLHCGLLLLVHEASSAVARRPPLLPSPAHSHKATLACFACARSCPPRPSSCVGGLAPSPSRGLGLVQSMTKPICAIGHRPIAFDRNPHALKILSAQLNTAVEKNIAAGVVPRAPPPPKSFQRSSSSSIPSFSYFPERRSRRSADPRTRLPNAADSGGWSTPRP